MWNTMVERYLFEPKKKHQTGGGALYSVEVGSKWTPLFHACYRGAPLEEVEAFLNMYPNGASDQDSKGHYPLHWAVLYSSVDVVQYLVDHDPTTVFGRRTVNERETPLDFLLKHFQSVISSIVETFQRADQKHQQQHNADSAEKQQHPSYILTEEDEQLWKKICILIKVSQNRSSRVGMFSSSAVVTPSSSSSLDSADNDEFSLHEFLYALSFILLSRNNNNVDRTARHQETHNHHHLLRNNVMDERNVYELLLCWSCYMLGEQTSKRDQYGNMPLHIACSIPELYQTCTTNTASCSTMTTIQTLLRRYPDAARQPDANGQLPLHICLNMTGSLSEAESRMMIDQCTIKDLIQANPSACHEPCNHTHAGVSTTKTPLVMVLLQAAECSRNRGNDGTSDNKDSTAKNTASKCDNDHSTINLIYMMLRTRPEFERFDRSSTANDHYDPSNLKPNEDTEEPFFSIFTTKEEEFEITYSTSVDAMDE